MEHGIRTRIATKYGKSLTWLSKVQRGEFNKGHPALDDLEHVRQAIAEYDLQIDKLKKELAELQRRKGESLVKICKKLGL